MRMFADIVAASVLALCIFAVGLVLRSDMPSVHLRKDEFQRIASAGRRIGAEGVIPEVVVFSDYRCTFSKHLDDALITLQERYADRLSIAVRHYVDPSLVSSQLAMGAECAFEQGWFEAYHRAAFANARAHDYWNGALLVADSAGIPDRQKFENCVSSRRYATRLEDDWSEAQSLAVSASPTLFVNGRRIVGAAPLPLLESLVAGATN
jgi:protein-disulfide isomerase